jgi:hypothetical protein
MSVLNLGIMNRLVNIGVSFIHTVAAQWGHLAVEEAVVVMVDIHSILDNYFMSLKDFGYVNKNETLKVLVAYLIDDEYDNIVNCNEEYKKVLDRMRIILGNSSCIFSL